MTEGDWGGPYVLAAFFCKAFEEKPDRSWAATDVLTAVEVAGEVPPAALYKTRLVVILARGAAEGDYSISVVAVDPTGARHDQGVISRVTLDRSFPFVRREMDIGIPVGLPETWWYEISAGSVLLTKIPVTVHHRGRAGQRFVA